MPSDHMHDAGHVQELDTAVIDALVDQAVLAEFVEPMRGLCVTVGNLSISGATLPHGAETKTEEHPVTLAHGKGLVIGRLEGGRPPYLDPRFRTTQRMPGNGQRIVVNSYGGADGSVSRGHFTLIGSPFGIIFVNGVPRIGGGSRPPMNGTQLIEPVRRTLGQGEKIVVSAGMAIRIRLPNQVEVEIAAA
jgi:hypothetical protein